MKLRSYFILIQTMQYYNKPDEVVELDHEFESEFDAMADIETIKDRIYEQDESADISVYSWEIKRKFKYSWR